MISQHDYHVGLEFKHNVSALDTEAIMPWCDQVDNRPERIARLSQGLVLAIWKIESLEQSDTLELGLLNELRADIAWEREMEQLITGVDEQARQNTSKRYSSVI